MCNFIVKITPIPTGIVLVRLKRIENSPTRRDFGMYEIRKQRPAKTPRQAAITWLWQAGIVVFVIEHILRFIITVSHADKHEVARTAVATTGNSMIVLLAAAFTILTLLEGRRWAATWGLFVSLLFMALVVAGLV